MDFQGLPQRIRNYQVISKLGEGNFATVYKVYDTNTSEFRALKELKYKEFIKQPKVLELLQNEIKILKSNINLAAVNGAILNKNIKYFSEEIYKLCFAVVLK